MIPVKYNVGHLKARGVATAMSIFGIGIVIAVMVSMIALYNGVTKATRNSGSKTAMMILREGAQAEVTSWVNKDPYRIIRSLPGIAEENGELLISPEIVVSFKIPKKDNPSGANVTVRGVTPTAFRMRPYVKIIEGRMFKPGVNEVIVSRRVRDRFVGTNTGDSFQFGPQQWHVVGVFEAPGTAFDSEIWADVDYLGQARKRNAYSSVLLQPVDAAAFNSIKSTIQNDNRLKLLVKNEHQYYSEQTNGLMGIVFIVTVVTLFMVAGAILATANTMFNAVASRGRELATLRALGFKRRTIIGAIVLESAFVAALGGVVGLILAWPVNFISTGTVNWQTFSEISFNFDVDGNVAAFALVLALVAGVLGGLFPAMRAATLPITRALREI